MEFKKFSLGVNQTKVARFADELAAGKIMATQCKTCGVKYYPPRADCSACMHSEMEWKPIEGEGTLVTFTKIYVPPEHLGLRQPLMPFRPSSSSPARSGSWKSKG
jgi:hypothetical protein